MHQFRNVLIQLLLVAALVTAALGHWVDTAVIVAVVIVNAFIGFLQEGKAERALESISKLLSTEATIVREGMRHVIPAEAVVPGDIVVLQAGDRVPADLRLFASKSLRVDESMLTGESGAVEKDTAPVPEHAPLGDRRCMAYSGTLVNFGNGRGIVTATGKNTELGRVSRLLAHVRRVETPLLRQIGQFARRLSAAILFMALAAFAFGHLYRGYDVGIMLLAAVGFAVAAIPEGLPAVMTITLAIGVERMAKRNAIIRRLPAVETLGSVTVICSDKTGTLTSNEMTVRQVITHEGRFEVSGGGYAPRGGFAAAGGDVGAEPPATIIQLARAGLLCNDAMIKEMQGTWILHGDPTEGALVALALKAGLDRPQEEMRLPRTDVIPFESVHRFMATLHHDHSGAGVIFLKGAPEQILTMCDSQADPSGRAPLDANAWEQAASLLATKGMRVLGLASKLTVADHRSLTFDDVKAGFTLLGMVGMSDPPRPEAIAAVAACQAAGIGVKMITGDHASTAQAIAREFGFADESRPLTGGDIEDMDDERLVEVVATVNVIARASPEHKLRLVQALQTRSEIVAMTGDGVNDAPALQRADIGIAMGRKGTESAKEAAEMVLADDNFASIVHAVEEGRAVYDNLKKALLFILPTNAGQALVILSGVTFGITTGVEGFELPITPAQILWVNTIVAGTLGLALAFEPAEADLMKRTPRPRDAPLLDRFLAWRVATVGILLTVGTLLHFTWAIGAGKPLDAARTLAINTLVAGQVFYLFNSRYVLRKTFTRDGILGSRAALYATATLITFQLLFTYAPPFQRLFGTTDLVAADWARVIAFGLIVYVLVEWEKTWLRLRAPAEHAQSG